MNEDPQRTLKRLEAELSRLKREFATLSVSHSGQKRVLEMMAQGASLQEVLTELILSVQAQADGMLGSILRYDDHESRLHFVAGPTMPDAYNDAIDGVEIGPHVGSCGTAAYFRRRVIVDDISTDLKWAAYRDIALSHDLRACWSQPVTSSTGELLGTFAMYYREPRSPSSNDIRLIESIANLAGIAIERELTEIARRRTERQLRQIIDLVPHMIFVKDRRGQFLLANGATAQAYGMTVEELVGRSQVEVHACEKQVSRMLAEDADVLISGRPKLIPAEEFTDAAGKVRILQTLKIPFEQASSQTRAILGVAVDITDVTQLEGQLSDYERNLEAVFLVVGTENDPSGVPFRRLYDLSSDFYLTVSPDGTITDVNKSLADALGWSYSRIVDRPIFRFVAPDRRAEMGDILAAVKQDDRIVSRGGFELIDADGTRISVILKARTVQRHRRRDSEVRLVMRDVTRHKELSSRLAQTEQLLTTGRLAAGIAHAINNPLQSIILHMDHVDSALPNGFEEVESWSRLREGTERIRQVVGDLLNLHRSDRRERGQVDLNELISEALALTDSQIRARRVDLQLDLQEKLPPVWGVPQHLYQVILNVILNALEALDSDGTLRVSTRSTKTDIVVEFEDTGPGIDPDDLPRIYDPLFSARKASGTGLGLYVTRDLVNEHNGRIDVLSHEGSGTMIRIELPIAPPAGELGSETRRPPLDLERI